MKYICVIGDIVKSRKVKNRAGLQEQLQKTLDEINRKRRGCLISPFTITLGDEFQVVYREADFIFNDLWKVLLNLHPVKVRCSVGIGELNTLVNPKRAIGMDGPAFYAARAGLTELKKSGSLFCITSPTEPVSNWINLALELISHQSTNWKRTRLLVFDALLNGEETKAIARTAGISPTAVYKNFDSGDLKLIQALFHEVALAINDRMKEK
jgi:hypothetical protein